MLSFDVVYVPQETQIAVHIETEIPIDISENSRKVIYDLNKDTESSRHLD